MVLNAQRLLVSCRGLGQGGESEQAEGQGGESEQAEGQGERMWMGWWKGA